MTTLAITGSTLLVVLSIWVQSFSLIPDLFRLNKECQEEGYYMAEFEFKMLGFAYYLDKGEYVKAITGLRKYHKQLKSRKGLIKLPKFSNKKEEMDFYLNLQNPKTGAFMDDSFPYCTYEGPTGNVLLHLEALAKETGVPFKLKYPLKFFDKINTPEKLTAYLDDLANIGWLAAKLPESSFHMVRDLISYSRDEDIVNRLHLYTFSPEWKRAMIKWFYKNQDPQTGYWGPRSRSSGKLLKLDLHNTGSIVKSFIDKEGNDIYPSFPLRYKDKMFENTLKIISEPPPKDDDLNDWHAYNLRMGKGVMLLTRYLWKDASREDKAKARKTFEKFAKIRFEQYYLQSEGAFSYYPKSQHATLDGTGSALGNLQDIGAFLPEKQKRLWGGVAENVMDLGCVTLSRLTEKDFDSLTTRKEINSLRFFAVAPDSGNFLENAKGVFYPRPTIVLDVMELIPKVKTWIDTTSQSMGNWISREETVSELVATKIEPIPVFKSEIPLELLNEILLENKRLTVLGFDVLQIARFKQTFILP
ncbi:MAG: hypothetical protein A2293_08750 [Elusimicrobia bacterium RIFOXYB2_FULL_49_7]|nr:MAG: hypothetical protein A2293_08750 [Elusimicrobia bacterium RIFOXYB2_FULL_49_7]